MGALLQIGDLEVSRVEDFVVPDADPFFLFPEMPSQEVERNLHWMVPNFYDPEKSILVISIHSWVIRTAHHTILVDTCGGNHKPRPHFPVFDNRVTPYLDNLHAAGSRPEDVDFVFCTHLHIDHVGWNTRLDNGRWVPTFPNATYLFSRREYESVAPADGGAAVGLDPSAVLADSVSPVVEAGQARMIEGVHQLTDQLTIEPAYGHSPGHSLLRAASRGVTGIFSGDALHHPLQIIDPERSSRFCADPLMAAQTRWRILEECADQDHLLLPAHFGAPHFGRVRRQGGGLVFKPGY